ncbi:alginate export family protein [Hymenobacter negativus]|uniref:alginate export family protein n=1 Tax=Hymenobacter negativus TaxID=2795026 RepID=UPI001F3998CD|nr:alginate export family protein [Hymenobacter negativus]
MLRASGFLGALLWAPAAFGQLVLSAEIRPRAELRDGFRTVNTHAEKPAAFVEQRSRLNVGYGHEKLQVRLSVQDVRIWGSTNQVYKTDPNLFNVFEAYGEYALTPHLAVRAGRQVLDYDNARFLGGLDWAQQGRSHDAVKFMYADSSGFAAHAGAAFNQSFSLEPNKLADTFYGGLDNYKAMQYLWLHKDWARGKLSVLLFNDVRQRPDSSMYARQTYGVVGERLLGKTTLAGEFYYQTGDDVARRQVRAYLAAVSATVPTKFTPLTFGVDFLSGSDATDTKNRAFLPLYGTNHAFYGHMDYFYVGNNHGQGGRTAGLADFYLKTTFKLGAKTSLLAHLHHFESPATVYAPGTTDQRLESRLGEELDLVLNANVSPEFNFKLGYSHFLATSSLDALKGRDGQQHNQWAWAMLTFKPVLFKN